MCPYVKIYKMQITQQRQKKENRHSIRLEDFPSEKVFDLLTGLKHKFLVQVLSNYTFIPSNRFS